MFEIKGSYTNALVYADICEQEAISQVYGLCNHPAFEDAVIRIMPDVHAGSGCTIGTTVKIAKKMVIPNIVGVDIGCGVLGTIFKTKAPVDTKALDEYIVKNIPSGHDIHEHRHSGIKKNVVDDVKDICKDLNFGPADNFLKSIGSLGGGNHFIEIDKIDDETYVLFVHTGSRNLGKKVCEYFQRKADVHIEGGDRLIQARKDLIARLRNEHREKDISKELINLQNNFSDKIVGIPRELAFIVGDVFDDYMANMQKCQVMAAESRRIISEDIINFLGVEVVETFDTIHNYIEEINENGVKDYVIRKGAVSAKAGEKLSIPLNMKDGVIIAIGKGNAEWNESAPHGAGRLLSRSKANAELTMDDFESDMDGINTWSVCPETLDESPRAYKPAESIIQTVGDTVDIICVAKPYYNFKAHVESIPWSERKLLIKEHKRKEREKAGL